ncbi:hypothetical protein IWQ55_006649 [Labrenzia sp. EL_208]|nr:hypothetical protein [Labrenzia sp. EL_132]MBG6233407.1 hypothetical protein [Labrenzia sp. EL_208]
MPVVDQNRTSLGADRNNSSTIFPILAFLFCLMIPIEFSIYLGPVLMTPSRLYLTILALPIFYLFFLKTRLRYFDAVFLSYVIWVGFAFIAKRGLLGGLEIVGQKTIELLVPYAISRIYIKDLKDIHKTLRFLLAALVILTLLALPEAVLKFRFLHEIPRQFTGFYYDIQHDTRIGLLRAASTFENPILFGLFSAMLLSMLVLTAKTAMGRFWGGVITFFATFLSLSSAALLIYVLQVIAIVVERCTRSIKHRWKLAFGGASIFILALETVSNRGAIGLVSSYLTLNPHTAYTRMQQWEYTIDDVLRNPFVGVRPAEITKPFWLTDSIDNHWLLVAVESGIPAAILLALTVGLITRALHLKQLEINNYEMSRVARGWTIGVLMVCLGGATVALFGKIVPFFTFYLGIGAALAVIPTENVSDMQTKEQAGSRKAIRFSRSAAPSYTRRGREKSRDAT